MGPDPMDMAYADLIILWGINAVTTAPHLMPFVNQARKRGARMIVIDPYRNRTARQADEHIMLRPGTDAALALGMMHVIVAEDYVDKAFVAQHTVGFEQIKARAQAYPPERVAAITGLSAEQIRTLARTYGAAHTSYIRLGIGLSRHQNGGMAIRAITCLPGLTGAWIRHGGGILLLTHGAYHFNTEALDRKDLAPQHTRCINMLHLPNALLALDRPPVKALYVYQSNPVAVNPNQHKLIQGLLRPDLFTVVHEQVFTDTTNYADILLPATTFLEHADFYRGYGHYFMQMAHPVIDPLGESKPDHEVFSLLARRMGFTDACFAESPEECIRALLESNHPFLEGIDYDTVASGQPIRLRLPEPFLPYQDGFPTASGKIEFYSEALAKQRLDPLPQYTPLQEGPENSALVAQYPLQLIVPPAHHFLNSTFGEAKKMQHKEGTPSLLVHPLDAASRGIQNGDLVRLFNARGETIRTARISEDTAAGVVVAEGVWWSKYTPGGRGINQLTSDETADLGGGSIFHSNLIEIERWSSPI
jgi:anaerobic selenocysteine-containing dehydrogenase